MTAAQTVQLWRERHPDRAAETALRSKCVARAKTRLAAMYPGMLEMLVQEECELAGIPRFAERVPPDERLNTYAWRAKQAEMTEELDVIAEVC